MTDILRTDTFRAASDTATIKVQYYVDFSFGPWGLFRIVLKNDSEHLARVLEDQLLKYPSKRKLNGIINRY